MITTLAQAIDVQTRRFNTGKLGVAKSVRRFLKRNFDSGCYVILPGEIRNKFHHIVSFEKNCANCGKLHNISRMLHNICSFCQ